jgi:hypothetical protein
MAESARHTLARRPDLTQSRVRLFAFGTVRKRLFHPTKSPLAAESFDIE